MEVVKTPYRAATSSTAKRTYLGTFFFLAASFALLCVAGVVYPVFYYNYVPRKVITIPVHLQYNAGLNPYGVTSVSSSLMLEQAYDVSVELVLPRSPANLERGNFMIALYAMRSQPDNPALAFKMPSDPYEHVTAGNVVFSSRRPTLLPYSDPLVSTASRVLFLLYHILFQAVSEKTTLVVPMGELVEFRNVLPLSLLLDVQAGQTLEVYSASITLVARLTGFRWLMYNHRIISFVICTTAFWLSEMLSMGIVWVIFSNFISGDDQETTSGVAVKREEGEREGKVPGMKMEDRTSKRVGSYSDDSRDLTTSGRDDDYDDYDDGVKREGGNIKVEDEETLVNTPRHVGDADDEEDGEELWRESGRATSFHSREGGGGNMLRRRSSRGSGRSSGS
ncbi:hypothetical protein F4778DRAFT_760775 [Xylariomycetidae sp. FL2044]|nr:hypothetical protein F4778DRAFT_760775 [Xylariomycetidae sp. FL2044]